MKCCFDCKRRRCKGKVVKHGQTSTIHSCDKFCSEEPSNKVNFVEAILQFFCLDGTFYYTKEVVSENHGSIYKKLSEPLFSMELPEGI